MLPPSNAQPCTDSLEKKNPVMAQFKTVAKNPPARPGMQTVYKENPHQLIYPAPAHSQFNLDLEHYFQKPSGKRVLMEAAPIKELRPAKKQKTDEPRPPPDSFPPIVDDGNKPAVSYATMIAMAIVRSPEGKLSLSQIYKWVCDHYKYYREAGTGWQNSIRHNLSLNKNFLKLERAKDDPGKGNYWTIAPGAEQTLLKEKSSRKAAAPTAENMPVMSTRLEPSLPQPQPQPQLQPPLMPEPMLPPQFAMPQNVLPALPQPAFPQLAPAPPLPLPEISSDATIIASDAATIDEGNDGLAENLLHESNAYSPLPAAMHSSPPIPRGLEARHNGTPPSLQRMQPSSATKSRHRRRFMSMDDSGYISSLDSSAVRPHQHAKLLTSEADRPRIKRGRAEEEIARLRASSYDSPSKGRSYGYAPPSSSPIRQMPHSGAGQMLPPFTPAMKLKAPPKPPPSISPGTTLRLHRENIQSMVDSPIRRVSALLPDGDLVGQQTPGLHGDHLWDFFGEPSQSNTDINIFEDAPEMPHLFPATPAAASTGSPAKRSVRKQRLERSQSTSALNNITNTAGRSVSKSASFLKVPNQMPNLPLETPSKVFEGLSSPTKQFLDLQSPSKMPLINDENSDWFHGASLDGFDATEYFEGDEMPGFDILAGFQKIGSSSNSSNAQASQGAGPNNNTGRRLARSYTTT
jgi:hypothetical protein